MRDKGFQFTSEIFQEEDPNFIRFYLEELTKKLINQIENSVDQDEYYRTISEKAALTQQVSNLKAENNLLLESQVEQYEKLKRTMQTLNEQKSHNYHLENEKRSLMTENELFLNKIKLYEDEKAVMERRMKEMEKQLNSEKNKTRKLEETVARKDEEIKRANEKLEFLCGKFEDFEDQQRVKDETISKLKCDNKELTSKDSLNLCAIEFLTDRVKTMEAEKLNLGWY